MILVIGSSHDDVLYLESMMRNVEREKLNERCFYFTGLLSGQSICVAYGLDTNYMSSVVATYLIQKFNAPVVINVGMARAFSHDLNVGDVVICKSVYLADVNMVNETRVKLTEIPGMNEYCISDVYLVNLLNKLGLNFFSNNLKSGTLVSSNNFYNSITDMEKLNVTDGITFLGKERYICLDNEAGGIAVSCTLLGVPFVSIKIIQYILDVENYNKESFINALKEYPAVGKLITSLIAEITNNATKTVNT